MTRCAVYFVASPLQYLAARRIAGLAPAGTRQVLVWYKDAATRVVRKEDWDAAAYMPWPRWKPLPGPFGTLRRLRQNIRDVALLVGPCEALLIHSAVFDTETINYFLRALPRACGARSMHARILPDGIISIRRYPLPWWKRLAQCGRKLRRLIAPELDYWCFSGDRIGSDAPFCDRIYVLPSLPHEYPEAKVEVLPPLVDSAARADPDAPRRALVIGQPLVGAGLMDATDRDAVSAEIHAWLMRHHAMQIYYKAHPKDAAHEMCEPDYQLLRIDEPLESHMSHCRYDLVVGVRSSALLFARQIYGPGAIIAALGLERVHFKNADERRSMLALFEQLHIEH